MKKEKITLNKLREDNPKARIGSFNLGRDNQKGFLVAEKSRDEYLHEIFSSISKIRTDLMFCFEVWYFATKLKIPLDKISHAGKVSVEEVKEILEKYSKIFEFFECSLNNYSFCEEVFKIFKQEIKKEMKEVKSNGRK